MLQRFATLFNKPLTRTLTALIAIGLIGTTVHATINQAAIPTNAISSSELAKQLQVGDVVFIGIGAYPFKKVSEATESWTNHVGVVLDVNAEDPVIAESTFPLSRATTLSKFVKRSVGGRVEVSRLPQALTPEQQQKLIQAAEKRYGIFYDSGFDLYSRGQFCSRFAREILFEATGTQVGEVENFSHLLQRNPKVGLTYWKVWYLGIIPWSRQTVTPASLLNSPLLQPQFDGYVRAS